MNKKQGENRSAMHWETKKNDFYNGNKSSVFPDSLQILSSFFMLQFILDVVLEEEIKYLLENGFYFPGDHHIG